MKCYLKKIAAVMVAVIAMFASFSVCVNAAEDSLDVDGRLSYKVGDTLTYSLCLEDSAEKLMGIQMYVYYDQQYLKVNADTLDFPKLPGAVYNTDLDGYFTFNWTNVTRLADFSEKTPLFTAEFEILQPGETEITYFIEEMYSSDMTYLKEYTLTVDYSQNGTVVKEDEKPIVEKDPEKTSQHQGQFINYEDGMGENNPNANSEQHAQNQAGQSNQGGHEPPAAQNNGGNAQGNGNSADNNQNTPATDANGNFVDENGKVLSTDANGNVLDENGNAFSPSPSNAQVEPTFNMGLIIIIVAVVLIVIAIIVVIILKAKGNRAEKEIDDSFKNNEDVADISSNEYSDSKIQQTPGEIEKQSEDFSQNNDDNIE